MMHVFDDGQGIMVFQNIILSESVTNLFRTDPDLMDNDDFYSGYLTLGIETHPGLYFVNIVTPYSDAGELN